MFQCAVWVVLKTATGINDAGYTQAVHFPHEMARGIELILVRQLGTFGKRRIQDQRIGLCQQQTYRFSVGVLGNQTAWRIRRVTIVAAGAQCCAI